MRVRIFACRQALQVVPTVQIQNEAHGAKQLQWRLAREIDAPGEVRKIWYAVDGACWLQVATGPAYT